MHDVWRNQFLFWAIMLGFVTLFPIQYIPVISDTVFKHKGITWEWAIVFIAAGLFFGGIEAWKFAKRVYFRRQARKNQGVEWKDMDLEQRTFGEYLTPDSSEASVRHDSEKVDAQAAAQRNNAEKKA
jgi:hypothetical protein